MQLEKAQGYQTYLTKKNVKSHFLVTRSGSRVFWWSLVQSIALVGVAICQVLIVKNFFGTNSTGQRIFSDDPSTFAVSLGVNTVIFTDCFLICFC